ncbi:MAG TPA: phosphatase PAP2 family protein [Propionibacteriaceae bacterium]|nr:phosphatase PAP2 family protein [Propionibacteriaceae bacterium]
MQIHEPAPIADPPRPIRRLVAYAGANRALMTIGAVGALIFLLMLTGSASVYDAVDEGDGISGLDQPALDYALGLRSPSAARWVTGFTDLGGTVPMVVMGVVLTVGMYLHWRRRPILTLMLVAAAGSVTFTVVGKALVGRNRPPLADAVPPYEYAPSFPSGHTLNSTVLALMLAYLVVWLARRTWVKLVAVAAALTWAAAMGLSRVYLAHHWLTDVIFGWVFGVAWLALLITVHRMILTIQSRRPELVEDVSSAPAGPV